MNTRGKLQRCFSHIYILKIRIEIYSPNIYSGECSAYNYVHEKASPNFHFKFTKDQIKLNGGNLIHRSESTTSSDTAPIPFIRRKLQC